MNKKSLSCCKKIVVVVVVKRNVVVKKKTGVVVIKNLVNQLIPIDEVVDSLIVKTNL